MITEVDGKKVLKIFENFHVERSEPLGGNLINGEYFITTTATTSSTVSNGIIYIDQPSKPIKMINNLLNRVKGFVNRSRKRLDNTFIKTNPILVFEAIINDNSKLKTYDTRKEDYQKMIKDAEKIGQVSLAEQLRDRIPIVEAESKLFVAGYQKCLSEERIVEFAEKCKKGLRLDWLKNFTRVIPSDIAKKKIRLDAMAIFDNYVILHYDPENKNTEMTKKEKEKAKDPILFGVIKDSRKLYYVDDWKDELCDLTLDEVVSTLTGKKKLNKKIEESIIDYIEKDPK